MKHVLVTGALGFIGRKVVAALAEHRDSLRITGLDLRMPTEASPGVEYVAMDLRDSARVATLVADLRPDCIVHLAAVVVAPPGMSRETMHQIDVGGTTTLLQAAVAAETAHFITTSSGAAYGYYADNPEWLDEADAIRGNEEFPYSAHKRECEELLARYRKEHPELRQLILRPGTVLGLDVGNQITAIFDRARILKIRGCASPFVFIWDSDVVRIIVTGVLEEKQGVYNLAGDGALSIDEIATMLGKPLLVFPAWFFKAALAILKPLGVVPWGPEQVRFLQYRPVLSNRRLKEEFGYTPEYDSRSAFQKLLEAQPHLTAKGR